MIDTLKIKIREILPKSHKNSRLIKAGICFLIAGILTLSIFLVQKQTNTVTTVLKPASLITAGTEITAAHLKEVEVGEYGLPKNILTEKKNVVGKYAATDLYPSDFIVKNKITDQENEPFQTISADKKIMSFTVESLAASVASNIKKGDTIQVIYSTSIVDHTGMNSFVNVITPECLKKLEVIDIKDAGGYRENEKKDSMSSTSTSFIPAVITVIVNDEQATALYEAEKSKGIHVVFLER